MPRVPRIALGRCLIASLGLLMLPSVLPPPAEAQYRSPRVYNPSVYNSNRSLMNRRAAARAAELRRYCRKHPRAERCRSTRAKAAQSR